MTKITMKRTQSKAVKPARKGAVKVPKGWRKLPDDALIVSTDQYWHFREKLFLPVWRSIGHRVDDGIQDFYIRRNPRAARATTKGAE